MKTRRVKSPGLELLKRELRARNITYREVGAAVKPKPVTWSMVWAVLNSRKKSARVMAAIHALLAETR